MLLDYGGDLSLALDQHPPPLERTQSLDVTTEEHTSETNEESSSKDGTYTKEVIHGEHRDILPLQGSFSRHQVHQCHEVFTNPKQSNLAPVGMLLNADSEQITPQFISYVDWFFIHIIVCYLMLCMNLYSSFKEIPKCTDCFR